MREVKAAVRRFVDGIRNDPGIERVTIGAGDQSVTIEGGGSKRMAKEERRLKRSDYESVKPLGEHEVLEGLKALHQEHAGHEAARDGLKEDLAAEKTSIESCNGQIHSVLRALNEDQPVYRLKDGTLTATAPPKQGEFAVMGE